MIRPHVEAALAGAVARYGSEVLSRDDSTRFAERRGPTEEPDAEACGETN
jgi:hypothetical protein